MQGISMHSLVPVRQQPSERSEMTTQLLFGESYDILDNAEGWLLIRCHHDQYEGWIDTKMNLQVDQMLLSGSGSSPMVLAGSIVAEAINLTNQLPVHLVKGSILPLFEKDLFSIGAYRFSFQGLTTFPPVPADFSQLEQHALSYINTPYLWGGRSPFGIDCSGFVQMVYRLCGYPLPRNASQQVNLGITVDFVENVRSGDLAFFDNNAGDIVHVGIVLGEGEIIHSSGTVHIDKLDHQGIFNNNSGKYTHKLRILKRISDQ